MRTKEDLLYELKSVEQVIKNGKRTPLEIFPIIAEVLIDIRDIFYEIKEDQGRIKESINGIESSVMYRDTGVR